MILVTLQALIEDDGTLNVEPLIGGEALPAGAVYQGGIAMAQDGHLYVDDIDEYEGDIQYVGGLACRPEGVVLVNDDDAETPASYAGGFALDADGALLVTDASPDTFIGRFGVTQEGRVVCDLAEQLEEE